MTDINPFAPRGMAEHVNQGTVNIEQSRAVTEAQGKLILAKKFPRDEALAYSKIMSSCSRPSLAASGEYAYPRGGQTVSGPSIRLAEELARCWGNIEYGIRELSRQQGNSEMEAYAWDLETNTYSSQKFTVRHLRDKKGDAQVLTEERDIYELTANMGGRRLRSRLLAILPPDLVEAAVNQCRKTLAGDTSLPLADRVRALVDAFSQQGVTEKHLRAYLNKSLDEILPEEIATLRGVYNSIKNGQAAVGDFFSIKSTDGESADLNRALSAASQETQA
ncbi:hypothetical protein [Pseudomonas sp. zfem003]|uniref:hypothetical protein n=1 Tax=Pseudomonas sp. zfem003 TaxID=3078198 RepID=UPI002927CE34|nr:hypothetical protein [Pseudomonas sp. zfem003]MDU9398081.1 hypothetical protein [Pseudomonas sp. zfem003]